MSLTHSATGRNRATVIGLALTWIALAFAWIWLQAAWWIILPFALFTLPALWDIYSARTAGMTLNDEHISWFAGKHTQTVPLLMIDYVRFDTRLDFSVRTQLMLTTGQKIRIPHECLPEMSSLDAAFSAQNISITRRHFSLLG